MKNFLTVFRATGCLIGLLIAIVCSSPAVSQDLHKVNLAFNDAVPAPNKAAQDLSAIRKAADDQKFDQCASLAKKGEAQFAEYGPWLRVAGISCQRRFFEKSKKGYKDLSAHIANTWQNSIWLLRGPHVTALRQELIDGTLALIDSEIKDKRKKAWANINKLTSVKDWLDHHELAVVYRAAGDLSFVEQNSRAARDYLAMSLREEPNRNVELRLKSIKEPAKVASAGKGSEKEDVAENDVPSNESATEPPKATGGAVDSVTTTKSETAPDSAVEPATDAGEVSSTVLSTAESSDEENAIFKRFREAVKAQNTLVALDEAMTLLKKFAGGTKAQQSSKEVLALILSLEVKAANESTADKFMSIKKDAISRMKNADGQRLFDWAATLAAKGYYNDAVELSQNSLEQVGGQPISTKILLLCAQSATHVADLKKARELFLKLAREHAGTKAASEATFRMGIIDMREQKYSEAAEQFEKYLGLENNSDYEASSMYWLWRSQQKTKSGKASDSAEKLISKYPLSYFGLRARSELAGGSLIFERDFRNKVQISLQLTQSDYAGYERYKTLALAGWSEEGKAELAALPMPDSPEAKLVFAELWAHVHDYVKASELLLAAFQKNPDYVTVAAIRTIYPTEYGPDIKREAGRYAIPKELVQALIKQESSYRADVKSPAGAIGLMQLLPSTAREVALDMKIKMSDAAVDLTHPQVNLKIGTNYLHRKLRLFDGHVPLALAAYNAGIGNIRTWLRSRQDLKDLAHSQTSQPETELWFDELPWAETSGYIKGILRNMMIYRLLDHGQYVLTDPVWKFTEKSDSST